MRVADLESTSLDRSIRPGFMQIDKSRKQALIVLGMHRSGTSAVTRVLSLLGARLPEGLLPVDQYNESGYWEPAAIPELHDEVLASVGSSWHDVSPFPESWFRSQAAKDFQSRVVEILEREYGDSALFVLKDPRICRLVPFWISVLKGFKAEPSFVITVRNPLEVAASLKPRAGFLPSHSLLLWLRHVLEAELQTRQSRRTILFYEDLLSDPIQAMTKVAEDIGIYWPQSLHDAKARIDAFLVQQYRHHIFDADELKAREDVSKWVKQAYKLLRKADDSSDLALGFDTIREELEVADRAFGPLVAASQLKVSELRGSIQHLRDEAAARESQLAERTKEVHHLLGQSAHLRREQVCQGDVSKSRLQAILRRLITLGPFRNADFDPNYYVARYPDVAAASLDPLVHYVVFGRREGRKPAPDQPSFSRYAELRAVVESGLFDEAYYSAENPDVTAAGRDPLEHFLDTGAWEGRSPSPKFDPNYYLTSYPDVASTGLNPLAHYFWAGRSGGRSATPRIPMSSSGVSPVRPR